MISPVRLLAALVTSLTLPFGGIQWWSVAPAGHAVLVTGSPPTGARCEFYVVDDRTWKGRGPFERACSKPPVSSTLVPRVVYSRTGQYDSITVAGRVVMRYEDASDTRPQWTTYGRSLWLYDVYTSVGAEALRFDAHTGKLLQRTAMPQVYRPVMVANGDGLWLDPAPNGGISGVNVVPVLHVAFGAAKPTVVHRGGRAALWMAASAHTVWLEQIAGTRSVSIWRIDGSARARLLSRPQTIGQQGAYGAGGLWELSCAAKEHLLRIDPDTGALTRFGQFAKTTFCDASMTIAGGDVLVLEGQKLYVYR